MKTSKALAVFMLSLILLVIPVLFSPVLAKTGSQTALTLNPTTIVYGSSTTCTATLKHGNSPISGATVTFTAVPSNVGTFSSTTATTNSQGVASVTYIATSVGTGTVTITASFAGDATYNPSNSGPVSLTVNKAQPQISVSASPSIIDKLKGESTTISGSLTFSGSGIGGETVLLSYFDGTTWVPIGSAVTSTTVGSIGTYSFTWTPNSDLPNGHYAIQAYFAGDSDYLNASISVGEGLPVNVLPEYAFGALAALGACFMGFAVFKKHGSLPQLRFS